MFVLKTWYLNWRSDQIFAKVLKNNSGISKSTELITNAWNKPVFG